MLKTSKETILNLDATKEYAVLLGDDKKEVPFGFNLAVSKDGKHILDMDTNKTLSLSVNQKGYVITSLRGRRFLVHRLVAMAWIHNPDLGYTDLVVNHKDCNKSNNHVDNLEWLTKGQNTQYAVQMREIKNIRGDVYYLYDLDLKTFVLCNNARHVSARTGLRYEKVNQFLDTPIITRKGKFVIFNYTGKPMGVSVGEFGEDDVIGLNWDPGVVDWNSYGWLDVRSKCDPNSLNVKATHIETKEVKFFATMSEAAKELDVPISSIWQCIDDPILNLNGVRGWMFQEVIDQGVARKYLKENNKLISNRADFNTNRHKRQKIKVTDPHGEVMEFAWIGAFSLWFNDKFGKNTYYKNIQRTALENFKRTGKRFWNGYLIEYN